jgi:hypothetical protein
MPQNISFIHATRAAFFTFFVVILVLFTLHLSKVKCLWVQAATPRPRPSRVLAAYQGPRQGLLRVHTSRCLQVISQSLSLYHPPLSFFLSFFLSFSLSLSLCLKLFLYLDSGPGSLRTLTVPRSTLGQFAHPESKQVATDAPSSEPIFIKQASAPRRAGQAPKTRKLFQITPAIPDI